MNRSELKSLVKECLVEILRDGIGSTLSAPAQQPRLQQTAFPVTQMESTRRPVPTRVPTQNLKEAIRREAGGNKVMESILADTASSTLPKMLQGESKGPVHQPRGGAEMIVAAAAPEEIFGTETASRWADLAFADAKK